MKEIVENLEELYSVFTRVLKLGICNLRLKNCF